MTLAPEIDADVNATGRLQIGHLLLNAIVGLQASVDGLAKAHQRQAAENDYAHGVHDIPFQATARSGATGDLFFCAGGPSAGRMWEIKSLVICGSTWETTPLAGDGIIYRLPSDLTAAGPGTAVLIATGHNQASLPFFDLIGARQVTLHYPDRLQIHIASPTANTVYAVGGTALELPDVQAKARVVSE